MAIAGTVLVTGVFCYMPFRELLKEKNKKTVSLQEETGIGTAENTAEELYKNMTNMSETSGAKADEDGINQDEEAKKATPKVAFEVKGEGNSFETSLYQSGEGICYVFLPGFAKEKKIRIKDIEDGGTLSIAGSIFREGDEIENASPEKAYECVLSDTRGNQLLQAPIIFLYASDLPVVSIVTDSGSMDLIHENKENSEPGSITVLDEQGILLYEGKAEKIGGRGNSTWGLLKKPYQFKLKEETDLFGFGESKSFNLMADGYDETKLRNKIALGLATELGMPYTPEGRSVDLYCNGEYYGIYLLCEKIEVGKERVDITDMEANSSLVYTEAEKENLETIVSSDGSRKWTDQEVEEADLSGGYLLERELPDRYSKEVSGFVTTQGDAYALQSPKYATENQVNYIADLMQKFQDAVEEKDGINKETGKHYTEYIDTDSFVKKYLVEEITKNYDGGVTSSFFYKPDDEVSTKIFAGPVWDYDASFGNCNLDEIVSNPRGIMKLNDHVYGTDVFTCLYEKEEFYRQVIQTYEEIVLPFLDRLLEREIDALSEEVRQSVKLDSIRWAELANRYQYYEEYDNDIRYLKYFIEKRRDFLNEVWLQGEIYHSVTFKIDGEAWKKIYVKDGETPGQEPVPARNSSPFMGWLSENHDVPFDEYKPIYEDITFYAIWQELSREEAVTALGAEETDRDVSAN